MDGSLQRQLADEGLLDLLGRLAAEYRRTVSYPGIVGCLLEARARLAERGLDRIDMVETVTRAAFEARAHPIAA